MINEPIRSHEPLQTYTFATCVDTVEVAGGSVSFPTPIKAITTQRQLSGRAYAEVATVSGAIFNGAGPDLMVALAAASKKMAIPGNGLTSV